jgi:putative chitinase
MADYFDTLTPEQKKNIQFIVKRMNEKGITNPLTQSAILSVVSKESAFIPKSETGYGKTSNARIRQIFGSRVASYDEAGLTALKSNDEAFFNAVYGLPKFGQTATEGYKYRGRGLNQITFKDAYKRIGDQIGVDLVNNPDKLNELPVATDCLIQFFLNSFKSAPKTSLLAYNTTDINGFKNTTDSVGGVYNANAGWGKSKASLDLDPTGGKAKATSRVNGFLEMINNNVA